MKVYAGIVSGEYGPLLYLDRTKDGLLKQVAEFCREWWDYEVTTGDEDAPDIPESDVEVIDVYFSYEHGEYLDLFDDVEVEDRKQAVETGSDHGDLVIGDRSTL